MYTNKNDLISRLVIITGKDRNYFTDKTVTELNTIIKRYDLKGKRTYLDVPYKDKDIVRLLGAKYDGDEKQWYIPQGLKDELFNKWKIK